MGTLTIFMVIFNGYVKITRGDSMDIIKKPINRDSIGFKLDLKVLRTYIDKKKSVSMKTGENPTMEILHCPGSVYLSLGLAMW